MSFILANFLGGSPGNSTGNDEENKQILIEKLTTKMVDSAHLEDRKAAAQTMKSLARSHRLEIGTLALQALVDELKRDLDDEELAKIVLETLDILCSNSGEEVDSGIEVQFCEILLKNENNVALLLDIMGDSNDFYLRFTSIQILIALCGSHPFQLQSAVLNCPQGVEKVIGLLKDSREIVRNEGLLFCGALVRGNADLQKILAFQGTFELVMQIIADESGPWSGPLIIQDAFNLISGLLYLNTSNQIYFRDSICMKQLAGFMALPANDTEDNLWNRTRISNYLAALSVLDGLLCKENVNLEASQNTALKTNFIYPLKLLAFNPKIPSEVSAAAINCLSGLIWRNDRAQQDFSKEKVKESPLQASSYIKIETPISPLMAAILVAVHGNPSVESFSQRIKASGLVEAFCSQNSEGQLILLSTIKASAAVSSPGSVIIDALFDLDASRKRDPWHCWFAAACLGHLIVGNEEAKKNLLKCNFIPIGSDEEDEGESVLTSLMLNLIRIAGDSRGSTCQKSIVGYLQLLVIWFNESSDSVKAFLNEGSFVQYLIERITQQSATQDTEIQGLSALILGICVLYNDESEKSFGSEALKGIIKNRIGPDLFVSRLSRLRNLDKNDLFNEASREVLMKNYESLMKLVVKPTPAGLKASHTATLAQLTKDLSESQTLLAATQSHLSETNALAEKLKIGISERDTYISQLQKLLSEKNQRIAQMAREMSTMEINNNVQSDSQSQDYREYYEKYLSDQKVLKSLNESLKSFQQTVAQQQKRIEELEAMLSSVNRPSAAETEELEKWKQAYHQLYDQVKEQLSINLSETSEKIEISEQEPFVEKGNLNLEVSSGEVEILSPSQFMSPIADDSTDNTVSIGEEDNVVSISTDKSSPELITFNQIPEAEKLGEYPELKEPVETSFNAAVIISEEFALNEPNPEADEIVNVQSISSECPPDNFLSSEIDDLRPVSREEIKSVLDFFDNLPEPSLHSNASTDIQRIQEGLNQLNVKNELSNATEFDHASSVEQVMDISQNNVVDSAHDNNNAGNTNASNVDNSNAYNADNVVEYSYENPTNANGNNYNYGQEPQEAYAFTQEPQEISDYTQESQESYNYAQEPQETYNYAQQPHDSYNNDASGHASFENSVFNSSHTIGDYSQVNQSEQQADYDYSAETAEQPLEQTDYSQQQPEYSQEQTDYSQEQHEYSQDHIGYPQEQIGASQDQIDHLQEQAEYSHEQTVYSHDQPDYSQEQYNFSQEQDYSETPVEYSEEQVDYSNNYPQEQVNYQQNTSEQQDYSNDYSQSQDQVDYSNDYFQSQDQVYTEGQYDQQQYEYANEPAEVYNQSDYAENQVDYSQEVQHEVSNEQSVEYAGDATATASNEEYVDPYYYYDEATGFTYGFDQNMNQYYYYDPNTGEYTYYTAEESETPQTAQSDSNSVAFSDVNVSEASSNPSLFDTAGPPMVSLQQHQESHPPSSLATSFVPEQVYNL